MTKVRTGPNCASIGLAQDAFVGVKHSPTFSRLAQHQNPVNVCGQRTSRDTVLRNSGARDQGDRSAPWSRPAAPWAGPACARSSSATTSAPACPARRRTAAWKSSSSSDPPAPPARRPAPEDRLPAPAAPRPALPLGQQFPQPGVRRAQPSRIAGHVGYIGHRPHFTTAGPSRSR
jgi:hypothetical protein